LIAASAQFPGATRLIGAEINEGYAATARAHLHEIGHPSATVLTTDFFTTNWDELLEATRDPLLIVGNPPWVTNSRLGALDGRNAPPKLNADNVRGIEALTGKSNFDVSEWMLLRMLERIVPRRGMVAMLCKTAVARKVLAAAWRQYRTIGDAAIHRIDALGEFGAAVDACLFIVRSEREPAIRQTCDVYDRLGGSIQETYAHIDGRVVSNAALYDRWRHLIAGVSRGYQWRSGVKHDCSAVMELQEDDGRLVNGLAEAVDVEHERVFPLIKGSDVGRTTTDRRRSMIVTQHFVGEDTHRLRQTAPKLWMYLVAHEEAFKARRSSIYKGQPPFAIFGVGPYSFAPWKVAVSSLHKRLEFRALGPIRGKPAILDDTCYFLPCGDRAEAELIATLLASDAAQGFYDAQIFWDAKRPITIDVLKRLSLPKVAEELGLGTELRVFLDKRQGSSEQESLSF
jgi:hypothetical protein